MKKRLVIMDMDGTLVDSEPAIRRASAEALLLWGIHAEEEAFRPFSGMGDDKFIGGVSEQYGVPYDKAMKEKAYEIYFAHASEWIHVFPWSRPLIEKLHKAGYALAVASASDLSKVSCNIGCIGMDSSLFHAIITGSDVQRKKPAPDIFLKAAEKAAFDPSDSVVLEDAVSGVMAAKSAGMTCIAVTTTFSEDALRQAGADFVVSDLGNAFDLIEQL